MTKKDPDSKGSNLVDELDDAASEDLRDFLACYQTSTSLEREAVRLITHSLRLITKPLRETASIKSAIATSRQPIKKVWQVYEIMCATAYWVWKESGKVLPQNHGNVQAVAYVENKVTTLGITQPYLDPNNGNSKEELHKRSKLREKTGQVAETTIPLAPNTDIGDRDSEAQDQEIKDRVRRLNHKDIKTLRLMYQTATNTTRRVNFSRLEKEDISKKDAFRVATKISLSRTHKKLYFNPRFDRIMKELFPATV